MKQRGFTLIELLVVLIIMLSIGGLVGGIFFVSLRSANKTNKTAVVRQNGNAAITQIVRKIRYTQQFDGLASVENGLYKIDGVCGKNPSTPAQLGLKAIKIEDLDASGTMQPTTFSCPVPDTSGAITMNTVAITDTQVSKVKDCQITCYIQDTNTVSVNIQFKMVDANDNAGLFENNVVAIPFETSVSLRNPLY